MIIIPFLSWIKDKLVESWKTLVWASVGVGMLAIAMTTTGQELQDRIITIGYSVLDQYMPLASKNLTDLYHTATNKLFKY